ncbi:hypothetical protein M0R45_034942 [Rubus argutus]|uniref:Uncharacterized protein n=1 Tax=Rubus argutus TaxID=59490 RepID=A0AAW1VUN2_RUBAR
MFMLSKLMLFYLVAANSLQSYTTTCHDDEIYALLQLKKGFVINMTASLYKGAYPKMASWKSAGNQTINCCSWDGVECDEKTGHVVGLHLSSSCLYGSINSDSSLFRLVHLQSLNLADNDFNFSQVPISIRNFQRLRYLNLSDSNFYGQVPSEVSQLSELSSLDISNNYGMFSNKGFLTSISQNLTGLEELVLSYINISSTVPDTLANLSLLTSLHLEGCDLFGQFPVRIFILQNLKVLSVSDNLDLVVLSRIVKRMRRPRN